MKLRNELTYRVLPSSHRRNYLRCVSPDDETSLISNIRISFVRFEIVISLVKILHIRRDTRVSRVFGQSIRSNRFSLAFSKIIHRSVACKLSLQVEGYMCACVYMMSLSLRFCAIIRSRSERSCFFEIFEFIAVLLYNVIFDSTRFIILSIYNLFDINWKRIEYTGIKFLIYSIVIESLNFIHQICSTNILYIIYRATKFKNNFLKFLLFY